MLEKTFKEKWDRAVNGNKICWSEGDAVWVHMGDFTFIYADRYQVDERTDSISGNIEELKPLYLYLHGDYIAQARMADVTDITPLVLCGKVW